MPPKRKPAAITASMFFKYDACPHWLYFDRFGDPKKKLKTSRFTEMLLEMGLVHEKKVIGAQEYVEVKAKGNDAKFKATLELMRDGAPRIYQGVLMHGDMVGKPDILERRDDHRSKFGPYYYAAIDIKSAERLSDAHRYQLVFYGELLKEIQGFRPADGYILNAEGVLVGFPLREFEQQFHEAFTEVRAILSGKCPPPHLTSGCKQSPWFEECKRLAKKTKDIALIYNVKQKTLEILRQHGIKSLDDAADLDARRLHESEPTLSLHTLERIRLQARSLIENRYEIRRPIELPSAETEIFFDIEGDPLRQVEYLFGFLERRGGTERYLDFLAERPEEEGRMWADFLGWIETLPPGYVVYHYGTYEQSKLASLERRYGGTAGLEQFRESMIDLNEIVK
ncbi:MAG: TM0106 family RecB-like putative nuclease, partial [Patescibacteria group bacterium]